VAVSRIQLKVMAAAAALVLVVVLVSGVLAERGVRARERESLRTSLLARAELVRQMLADLPFDPAQRATLDAAADRAGAAAGARVTLIAADGTVVGDSEVPEELLPSLDNHAQRPEVLEARAGGVGWSERHSATLMRHLLYVAVPRSSRVPPDVVRVAMGLGTVDAAVGRLRRELLAAGAVGMGGALALSFLISWLVLRPLRELSEVVGAIAEGKLERRLRWPSRDELGQIAASINSVAEQLRARLDEATAEKEQLAAVLSSMMDGVLVLDRDGRIVLANPRLRELLSAWGSIEGRKPIEVMRHSDIDEALRAAADSDEPVVRELEVGANDPRKIVMHAAAYPSAEHRAGTVAVFHDVTELQRLEQVRRDFIANASHELRTPLTSIRGFADTLLSKDTTEEERRTYLQVILRNSQRLTNLMEDLLELSRIESRKVPMRPTEVDVIRTGRILVADLEPRLREARLRIEVRATGPGGAWADRRAVEQVIANLLDNAVKYTNPGGRIELSIAGEGEVVRVSVADTGIGIPEEDRGRIFERFYRVDKARSRALGGTGLGLSIVKHLVQAMGGDIWVESQVGKGTRFTFTLPAASQRPPRGAPAPGAR
jgi:two-component system phosphate regulon sensor histidine kinase PhoR